MADITPSYTYTDGATLDTDGHNKNIYQSDSTASEGIMSTANGGLDSNNLKSSFRVQPEHVQVEQVVIGRQETMTQRVDCFGDAFARGAPGNYSMNTSNVANATTEKWVAVPGCGIRYYQPYDCTLALWQWSVFFHPARVSVTQLTTSDEEEFEDIREELDIGLAIKLDGTILDHTRRQVPVQWVARDKAYTGSGSPHLGFLVSTYGGRTAQWWDMSHLATTVSSGYHDIQLVIYMERFSRDKTTITYTPVRNGESLEDAASIRMFARCSFGVRNARVLSIL